MFFALIRERLLLKTLNALLTFGGDKDMWHLYGDQ